MIRGKITQCGPWNKTRRTFLFFMDVGDRDPTGRVQHVSIWYYQRDYRLRQAHRNGQVVREVSDLLREQVPPIVHAALAYEAMNGTLDGFPEQELDL